MQIHASCATRDGAGVLLFGEPGSGKSDLLLRLLDFGFELVADDRVELSGNVASAPATLVGLLEVRGVGIVRLPHVSSTQVALAVQVGAAGERLPEAATRLGVPLVQINPRSPSAAARVRLALDCALGRVASVAGPFA